MLSVFFIDDDENLINGLKRSMRVKNNEWEMVFFTSAKEAVAILGERCPDVIVSDYKMPGMDGMEFMEIVKNEFPDVKRIILSGHYEFEGNNKLDDVVDLVLPKPCESTELIENINKLVNGA